jgi:hypothetical protein
MTLLYLLIGIGLFILLIGMSLQKYGGDVVALISLTLCFFFVALAGLLIIIRREVDFAIIGFEGLPAVLYGIVLLCAGFITSALFFVGTIRAIELIRK